MPNLIEAQRELAQLATGCRPPFDPDKTLADRIEAVRCEMHRRFDGHRRPGVYIDGDRIVFSNVIVHLIDAPDEVASAYLVLTPPSPEITNA